MVYTVFAAFTARRLLERLTTVSVTARLVVREGKGHGGLTLASRSTPMTGGRAVALTRCWAGAP